MTWPWISVAVYLTICYVGLAISYWVCNDESDKEHWEQLCDLFVSTGRLQQMFTILAALTAFLVIGPFMPLVLAVGLTSSLGEINVLRRLSRQHRDVILQPIAFDHMHPAAREYINQMAETITAAGFCFHDSFLYKPEPFLIQCRCYLSEDGRSVLLIGHVDGDAYYSLTSLLSGGAGVETSVSAHSMDLQPYTDSGDFFGQMFTLDEGKDVASIVAIHEALLARLRREHDQAAVVIQSAEVRHTLAYVNRKFSAVSYALGRLDKLPPTPIWPLAPKADNSATNEQDTSVIVETGVLGPN